LMLAPGAAKLLESLRKANIQLLAAKKDPIAYLPAHAEFLTIDQILHLSLRESGDFLLTFPFADKDLQVVLHEIAYHLGAIVYPRIFFVRARQINRHTENIARELRARAPELGHWALAISDQLVLERVYEMDSGTADIQAYLAESRSRHPGMSYKDLSKVIDQDIHNAKAQIQDRIDFLARPNLRPMEAVFARLNLISRQNPGEVHFPMTTNLFRGLGRTFRLKGDALNQLQAFMRDYENRHKQDDISLELTDSATWMQKLFDNLDERIRELENALGAYQENGD
jgi:hypothetical protein